MKTDNIRVKKKDEMKINRGKIINEKNILQVNKYLNPESKTKYRKSEKKNAKNINERKRAENGEPKRKNPRVVMDFQRFQILYKS